MAGLCRELKHHVRELDHAPAVPTKGDQPVSWPRLLVGEHSAMYMVVTEVETPAAAPQTKRAATSAGREGARADATEPAT